MALKNILVVVDNTKAAANRVEYAAALADKHDAHVTGLYVKSPPSIPAYVEAAFPPDVRKLQFRMLEDMAAKAKTLFSDAMTRAGHEDRSEWRVAHGDAEKAAEILVRYADLVIAGQIDPEEDDRMGAVDPRHLIMGCGRPVLLVPYAYRHARTDERVLVAWDGSRESARAVADAMPLLEKAGHVTVLAINPGPELGEEPCADISLHLARHDVRAEAAHIFVEDIDPSDALLSRAADLSADLIVMGAYGRHRLRDVIMGGVTAHMLRHMTVPVLMSH
jgi:nucleotide-binding universal stress UspA family protein